MVTQHEGALHQIVIVGGGAGGLELAVRLGKRLGKKRKARIILVDASRTHLWKPLLHQVAAGTLDSHADEREYFALFGENNCSHLPLTITSIELNAS